MRKPQSILLYLIIVLIFFTYSCKKDENGTSNQFPANTETGANTFIFRVNGGDIINVEVGYIPAMPKIYVFYNYIDTTYGSYIFTINGNRSVQNVIKKVRIHIKTMPSKGIFVLSDGDNYASYSDYTSGELNYYSDISHTGTLEIIKLDITNHIISGKFKFEALHYIQYNVSTDEKVIIDGQFDVKYIPNDGAYYY